MNEYNIRVLSTASVSESNFKSVLVTATNTEIRQAICRMENGTGKYKTRIAACKRELMVRERVNGI